MPKSKKLPPIHPGEILREDFMLPLGLSINKLALELHVPATRIHAIVNSHRDISVDTAMRLARYFGNSVGFWLNLQRDYEIEKAEDELAERITEEVRPRAN